MKSKLLWRNKKYEEASFLISDIKFENISQTRKIHYLNLKGQCFEKFKNFNAAHDCFSKSNSLIKSSDEYLSCKPNKYFQNLKIKLRLMKINY